MEPFQAKRAAIIYNPFAGRLSRAGRSLQRTIQILAGQGTEALLVPTTGPGTASAQTRQMLERGYDLIVAAGGDGTINEIANGMAGSMVPLAILPGGTANVLARELRLPISLERAASQIQQMVPCRIATGVLGGGGLESGRTFLLMAGAGLDAEIVYRLNLDLKAATGKFAYYVAGFSQVARTFPEFEVIVDAKPLLASFALISRVRNYGGDMEIARGASLLRNDFEVVLFRGNIGFQYLPYLVGVALRFAEKMSGCTILYARSVTCRPKSEANVFFHVDGELSGSLPFTAEIVPDSLTVMVPRAYLAREQTLLNVPVYENAVRR